MRGALILQDRALDIFAATTAQGRTLYSSYLCCWEMLKELVAGGIKDIDFGGIDKQKNLGVYNFKKGTAAREFRYLGEWGMASSALLVYAFEILLFFRTSLQKRS